MAQNEISFFRALGAWWGYKARYWLLMLPVILGMAAYSWYLLPQFSLSESPLFWPLHQIFYIAGLWAFLFPASLIVQVLAMKGTLNKQIRRLAQKTPDTVSRTRP